SSDTQLPPLRSIDDFLITNARFGRPDYQDKERWNNRIVNNLLYYQTNYLAVAVIAFGLVTYVRPLETIVGGGIFLGLAAVALYATNNRGDVQKYKKDYPAALVVGIVAVSTLVMYTLGSIVVFVFSIALPMLLVLLHASFRMRNLKNKVQNKVEAVGLKKTPMGVIMRALDQELSYFNKACLFLLTSIEA
uniref:PRA1 family protein n=2 Tax=Ciona savignyi TaxID=51511 RepID=H2Y849_CIOSA